MVPLLLKSLWSADVRKLNSSVMQVIGKSELDTQNLSEIESLIETSKVSKEDVRKILKGVFDHLFKRCLKDKRVSLSEKEFISDFMDRFELSGDDVDFKEKQKVFNKSHVLWLIENDIFPEVGQHSFNFVFKEGEKVAWAETAILLEEKRVAKKINYGGFTASIPIAPGFRYRAGSMNFGIVREEFLLPKDTGYLWITNQRIGFEGEKNKFQIPLGKFHTAEFKSKDIVAIFKDGKQSPYLVQVPNPEIIGELFGLILKLGGAKAA